jgi:glycosyltransferase involved in cell wall biosynthesis
VDISIVVPAFSEERRIGRTLGRLLDAGPRLGIREIIVVDDGSHDRTAEVAAGYAPAGADEDGPNVRVLSHRQNRGKGAALRTGGLAATGDAVAFLDADLSVAPQYLEAAVRRLQAGVDLVVGTRVGPDGASLRDGQPLVRRAASTGYRWMQRAIVGLPYADTQCPFKVFTRDAARAILAHSRVDRWSIDVELLVIARQLGLRVEELPVRYRHVEGSTVALKPALVVSLPRELLAIRRAHGRPRPTPA